MNQFKIRIYCTRIEELNLYGKPLSKKSQIKPLIPESIEYIESILLIYKTLRSITIKSLEFMCNKKLSDDEFIFFINILKFCGYKSRQKKHRIEFIHISNEKGNSKHELIFSYDFISCKPLEIMPKKKLKNKSTYRTQSLYKKNH